MNTKKFFLAFIVVLVILEITNYLIHGVFLMSTYESEGIKEVFRPQAEMESKMWIMWVADLVWSFFFTFIFVKGYENKGIAEGIKYGIYMGFFFGFVMAYSSYAIYPLPYSLTFQWFVFSLVQSIILGIVAAMLYKPKPAASA